MDYSGKIIRKNPVVPSQTSASGVWTLDDALQATRSNTWPIANVPDPMSRSLRFRASASAFLNRTPATTTNQKIWTFSTWVKRGALTSYQDIFSGGDSSSNCRILFNAGAGSQNDNIFVFFRTGGTFRGSISNAVFRDPSAWYHLVVAIDTTQATDTNRVKIYINGVQQTTNNSYGSGYVPQNTDTGVNTTTEHRIGDTAVYTPSFLDGYLSEVNFIDGQALTPSSFGGTNAVTGVWEPRPYTGTYGTNGFLLTFSDITSTATLGNDTSGNSNNWTTNNISLTAGSTYDSMLDVPTQWIGYNTGDVASVTRGNYAVMNPLDEGSIGSTISNGNLTVATASTGFRYMGNTMWVSSGKFYAEFTLTATSGFAQLGIATTTTGTNKILGNDSTSWAYESWTGQIRNSNSASAYGATWTTNDVIGICLDKDTNKLYFSKNGVWQNSADPAAGTGSVNISGISGIATMIAVCDNDNGGSVTFQANFGQRPFAYTPPAGFLPLCTTNLPSPTILQGNQYFDVLTYTGTGGTRTLTGLNFQPDFVWNKTRSTAVNHTVLDVVRGVGTSISSKSLVTNNTQAESWSSPDFGFLSSFNSNGVTFTAGATNNNQYNENSLAYVQWNWKANGTGVTNTAGSITSTVSANTSSGFSIVTYTGTGANATVGHGLGVAPRMIITKVRSTTNSWFSYHASLGAGQRIQLNETSAATASGLWQSTNPTSTVFSISSDVEVNGSGRTYVAYCFSEVAGYSRFGSYTGNGSTDGPFVFTGFRPKYILWKNASAVTGWGIRDTSRNPSNVANLELAANSADAEVAGQGIDILSNGFKLRTADSWYNGNGNTMIFMAFAESPFKNALAR